MSFDFQLEKRVKVQIISFHLNSHVTRVE